MRSPVQPLDVHFIIELGYKCLRIFQVRRTQGSSFVVPRQMEQYSMWKLWGVGDGGRDFIYGGMVAPIFVIIKDYQSKFNRLQSIYILYMQQQKKKELSDAQLQKLLKKYIKGCNKIYHQPGIMNAKGDALYDFTCNFSHRCPDCEGHHQKYDAVSWYRKDQKIKEANKKKTEETLEVYRKKYLSGKPGCQCKKDHICQACLKILQEDVSKYENGCGKTWSQNFGGMAAGPAWVKCYNNYFLCEECTEPLAFIKRLQKDNPHIKLKHIPEEEKQFWSPSSSPYYQGNL